MVSDASETVAQPAGPAAPIAGPSGPDPFAQMVQQLEAELRSSETRRDQELKESKDAGEDVVALERSHKREQDLEQRNVQLAKALVEREKLVQRAYIAEISREIAAQAKRFGLDEDKVRGDFIKTKGMPEDLDRIVQQHRLDKFEAGQTNEEEPEVYDSARLTGRSGPDLSKLQGRELLRAALERAHRSG